MLDILFRTNKLASSTLDLKCFEALADLPPAVACNVLDRFAGKDLSAVRNMSAYFMTHLKQVGGGGQYANTYLRV